MNELLIELTWIFIVAISFLAIVLVSIANKDNIKKFLSKIEMAKVGDFELKLIHDILNPYDHIFFYNIKRYLKYEDNYPSCEDKIKNQIITNMLRSKLECWYKNYFDFFSSHQTINASSMNNVIEKTIQEYEDKWKESKIPQYVIDEFNKKHNNKINYMTTEMKYLFTNNKDDKVFIHIFLNRSLILLEETFQDMEKTLKNIKLKEEDKKYDYIYQAYIP
jgi:hypothetical protein